MSIKSNIELVKTKLKGKPTRLVAVTKTHPIEVLQETYDAGAWIFGENKVQEMVEKWEALPKDIEWHLIGHLQSNKVRYMAHFVSLIHSVDSLKLLEEINKQAAKHHRVIDCLLQIYIAQEETKFGLSQIEAKSILASGMIDLMPNIRIVGVMGMATNTDDKVQIRREFASLKTFFEELKSLHPYGDRPNVVLKDISMGMSGDYQIAAEEGSTLVRVGSAIFGERHYEQEEAK